jgi:two-component system response regulator AtoC
MTDILIVDDEKRMGLLLKEELQDAGYTVDVESSGAGALARLDSQHYALVLSDIRMSPPDGLEILRITKEKSPSTDVIMMTAYASTQTAVHAMKLGAFDYVIKPFDMEEVRLLVQRAFERQGLTRDKATLARENASLRDQLAGARRSTIIGESAAIQELRRLITLVAESDATVFVKGASGAGKELVAAEIHAQSRRAGAPFVAVNCAAIPDTLLEGELFGSEKGAFTGADARKIGRFEMAQHGTILLDEIGEMGAGVQAKLLRVLEERKIMRLGGTGPIDIDIRIVAATNRNLEDMIRDGRFRDDLYYRLNVFPIEVPPLAARRADVPLLAEFFLRELRYAHPKLPADALDILRAHDWPGNVRELRNVVERATILARGGPIEALHFTLPRAPGAPPSGGPISLEMDVPEGGIDLEQLEKNLIGKALVRAGGNKSQAARLLGMTRRTLYSRMEKHGIQD